MIQIKWTENKEWVGPFDAISTDELDFCIIPEAVSSVNAVRFSDYAKVVSLSLFSLYDKIND